MIKKAVIYGHSQAQPTGMGDDLLHGLKLRGYSVQRLGLHGKNDAQLFASVGKLGDVSKADRVYLYLGGNSSKPTVSDILKLIQYFGAYRTTVILSPVNLSLPPTEVSKKRAKMKGNRDGISHLVPVYTVEAYANSFQPDGAHLLPKTPISKALVAAMLDDPDPKGGHFTEDPAAVDPEPEKDTQQSSYSSDGKDATDQAVVAETEESGSSVLLFFVLAAVAAFLLARRRR